MRGVFGFVVGKLSEETLSVADVDKAVAALVHGAFVRVLHKQMLIITYNHLIPIRIVF